MSRGPGTIFLRLGITSARAPRGWLHVCGMNESLLFLSLYERGFFEVHVLQSTLRGGGLLRQGSPSRALISPPSLYALFWGEAPFGLGLRDGEELGSL